MRPFIRMGISRMASGNRRVLLVVVLSALAAALVAAWFTGLSASDKAAWFSGLGSWISGIGALIAAWAALDIASRQFRRERMKERAIALSIAPALIEDLKAMRQLMKEIHSRAAELEGKSALLESEPAMQTFRLVNAIRLPTFDRFKDQLPLLGSDTSPTVIEVYAKLIRLHELNRGYSLDGAKLPTGLHVHTMRDGAWAQIEPITKAINLLSKLSTADAPTTPLP